MNTQNTIPVWDPLVRVFHWLLAGSFLVAWLTAEDAQFIHHLVGYLAVSLVIGRIVWGFIGSAHARFSDFVTGPETLINYLKAMRHRQHPRYLGHNPAGAVMILLLLGSILATAFTGMATLGIEEQAGPLAGWVQNWGWHDDELFEEFHEFFSHFTQLLVFFHVSGVIVESWLHRDNLIKAMFTGRKKEM
jgi:cytochrome b